MQGIGDLIYVRPFIQKLAQITNNQVYLDPVIPELFSDINLGLRFVDSGLPKYRTQQKSYLSTKTRFETELPEFDRIIDWKYGRSELKQHGIVSHLEHAFGFNPDTSLKFNLPYSHIAEQRALLSSKKIAIIRPPTVRKEWISTSKNPDPIYINWCTRILKDAGYYTISIADCADGEEWLEGEEPPSDLKLHKGEFGILGTLNLFHQADVVIGGPGFIVPAAISAGANLFVIFGGRGEYDNPRTLFDPRMDLKKIGWALPDNFCRCNQMSHECDKMISTLDDKFFNFLKQIQ
jgi:hypothetical protein